MNNGDAGSSVSPGHELSPSGDGQPSSTQSAAIAKPPSVFRACKSCKQRKVRCVPGPGNRACAYCERHNTECVPMEPQIKRRRTGNVGELKARIEQLEGKLQQAMEGPLQERLPPSISPGRRLTPLSRRRSTSPRFTDMNSPSLPSIANNYFATQADTPDMVPSPMPYLPMGPPARTFESWQVGNMVQNGYSQGLPMSHSPGSNVLPPPSTLRSIMEPLPSTTALRLNRTGQPPTSSARSERPMAEPDDEDSANASAEIRPDRLLGPISIFDDLFYDFCLQRGLANQGANGDLPPEKRVFWNSLSRLSSSGALSVFRISFPNVLVGNYKRAEIPEEAANEFAEWQRLYGIRLTELFRKHISPRFIQRTTSEAHFEELMARSYSFPCAVYAMAAYCNTDWPMGQRIQLGNAFHRFAGTYFQREAYPITIDSLKTALLLSEYPVQYENLLLTSWCVSFAFELKLHIDPEDWALTDDERYQRRVLWYYILAKDRLTSMSRMQVLITDDAYDVELPEVRSASDLWLITYVKFCDVVARLVNSLYSVRGIRTFRENPAVSQEIARQLASELHVIKGQVSEAYAERAEVSEGDSQDSEHLVPVSLLQMRLCIEGAIVNTHRPFLQPSKLNVFDALEHQRCLLKSCKAYVDLIADMTPAMCDELWPWTFAILNVVVTMTLLRLMVLFPDPALRETAKSAFETFLATCKRLQNRWYLSRIGSGVARFANILTGTQEFSKYAHSDAAEELKVADERVSISQDASMREPTLQAPATANPAWPFELASAAAGRGTSLPLGAAGLTDDLSDWATLLAGSGMDPLFLAGNWGI